MARGQGQSLWVSLKARTKPFENGMKRAKKQLRSFKRTIPGASLLLSKFGAALSAAGVVYYTRGLMTAIDAQKKFADRVGISSEALAGLEHAGEQTGVQVNQLRMGLQRMTRRVAEAAQGTGEAKGAIRELGLSARYLASLSPDEQFREIAEAMKSVSNQGDRVRLAMKLFDSEGVALVNTLALGRSGLDEYAAAARRMGIAVSNEQAAAIEKANDRLDDLQKVIRGAVTQAVSHLSPLLTEASEGLLSMADSGDGLGTSLIEAFRVVAKVGAYAVHQIKFAVANIESLVAAVQLARWNIDMVRASRSGDSVGVANAGAGIVRALQAQNAAQESIRKFWAEGGYFSAGEAGRGVDRFFDRLLDKMLAPQPAMHGPQNITGALPASREGMTTVHGINTNRAIEAYLKEIAGNTRAQGATAR